jgi:AcrR family transcriptional regulator
MDAPFGTSDDQHDDKSASARERVVSALVDAAIDLFGTRGPDAVSLREVAAKANVNYGLIHHYVGTKDDLISLALRQVSSRSTERFSTDGIEETVRRLVETNPASPNLRLLAWSLLKGRTADDLVGRSRALATLADLLSSASTSTRDRQRIVGLMSLILGWQLFGNYLSDSLELPPSSSASTRNEIIRIANDIVMA